MRIGLLTREFPPDVYGGAGVHVEYLVRELRKLVDVDVHCFGEPRAGREAHEVPHTLGAANAALQTLGRRPGDRRRGRWVRRRPLPHLVRQHGRPPRRPAPRHPARRDRALPRAAPAVEGRAARRWLRALVVGRADGLRGRRRGHRGEPGHARRHPRLLPHPRSRQGARRPQRDRHRRVRRRPGDRRASRPRASTCPSRTRSSSVASPGRRGSTTWSPLRTASTPTSSSCCARGRRTPPRSARRRRQPYGRCARRAATACTGCRRCCPGRTSSSC